MNSITHQLESIVGTDALCPWEALEPSLKHQITQAVAPNSTVEGVVYPETQEMLGEVIAWVDRHRCPVLICGSASKLHWGGLATGIQLVISTARLNRLVDHAVGDLTVTAEAGMKLSDLQAQLATAGQFLAIDPAYPDTATLGGIVATADTGALRQRYGSVRDMLIGLSIVRSDGQIAKAGGRVVKNVAGYDLMKLFTGSYGTLGAIAQVSFRIYPLPPASQTVFLTGKPESIANATATLLASGLSPVAIELVTPEVASVLINKQAMGLIVRFQSLDVSVAEQTEYLQQLGQTIGLHSQVFPGSDEQPLWQQLQEQMQAYPQETEITCKIGVLPSNAVDMLSKLGHLAPLSFGLIHAASGLGLLRFDTLSLEQLAQARALCQVEGGFLSVLAAPVAFKQSIDVWGYVGNAFATMKNLKQQFDPENLFSPHRFVNGI
ncbi:FAD-binding oxidoreductase [Thermocoleostomius sinensis]|uniref:FAD-binding oxidoreductase n=1 Tax=Thermocoleostomius sinensis A174 TaxID=2016057 RepID=A0A9E8ZDJ3_9CYAN|nr:FAD-binding oxidoreductase [Thermocoleostomius sinensis]WAL60937.1 FAD-binding oxidoreductase [Thermocoleostomius sinensis A174]